MHQQGGTIENALRRIESHEYVLPAIQREFVWQPEQVCTLFESLMQGYPFGEFMLWRVNPENADLYRWYDFVREYHQRDNPHCPELSPIHGRPVTAVLDGQQRLTAFNIGLRGSMARKIPTGDGTVGMPFRGRSSPSTCWQNPTTTKRATGIPSSLLTRAKSDSMETTSGSRSETSWEWSPAPA